MKETSILRAIGIITSLSGILLILFGGIKTVENFRILSDFIQNILLLNLILLLFLPDNRLMKIAMIIGILTVIIDYVLETEAVYLDWWYPLGGTQFPPFFIIPLEMVISFFLIGMSITIILTFPEKIRESNFILITPFKKLFDNPKWDWSWRFLLILGNAFVGTNGDYTAGPEIWVPGTYWHPFFTFLVWLNGGIVTLLLFYMLDKKIKN